MRKQGLRSTHAPARIDFFLNETAKIFFGSIVFFSLYYTIFVDLNDFFLNLSNLIILNLISCVAGYIISYFVIRIFTFRSYQKRSFFDLNTIFRMDKLVYEIISILLNSVLGALLVLNMLMDEAGGNLLIFFLYWIIYKFILALFAYYLSNRITANALLLVVLLIIFGVLLI